MNDNWIFRQDIVLDKIKSTNNPATRARFYRPRGNIAFFILATLAYCCVGFLNNNIHKLILLGPSVVSAMRTTSSTTPRRSARLSGVSAALAAASAPEPSPLPNPSRKTKKRGRSGLLLDTTTGAGGNGKEPKKKTKTAAKNDKTKKTKTRRTKKPKESSSETSNAGEIWCLPRTRETSIISSNNKGVCYVIGVDEAGRGPLAGPVVAAAAIVPIDIDGITDSKKITKEQDREDLYKAITESANVRWAVAVMDAPFIDKVNILQATMRGMEAASTALAADAGSSSFVQVGEEKIPVLSKVSYQQDGCYVVTNSSSSSDDSNKKTKKKLKAAVVKSPDEYCALVDGNRIPPGMPCESESIVKGDSKEYGIAAASILAKVSRDRLMRDYHELWPHFGLDQHKGYPTAAHMGAVRKFGASTIHRRTFKPLKNMIFDKDGNILSDDN